MFTLNCRGRLLVAEEPQVIGIINATPNSFFRGDLNSGLAGIAELAAQMLADGASMIDIGAQSSAPGAEEISETEELGRLLPALEAVLARNPAAIISVDTYRAKVAKEALAAGASIINDISGGILEPEIMHVAADRHAPFICMHMRGTAQTMHEHTQYDDLLADLMKYFSERVALCREAGIRDIIIDPGFGFAKTAEQNFYLLTQLQALGFLNQPILAGVSRKSTIYKTLGTTAEQALNGTTVLNTIALMNGASILRVHDVKEAVEAVKLTEALKKSAKLPSSRPVEP